MIRILELTWLCIALVAVIYGIYQFSAGSREDAVVLFFAAAIAAFMYLLRRRQRQKMQNKN